MKLFPKYKDSLSRVWQWLSDKCLRIYSKCKDSLSKARRKIFEWTKNFLKSRLFRVGIAFLFGCFLAIALSSSLLETNFPNSVKWCLKTLMNGLKKYPTQIIAITSLPVALVLWLFRNHDIVMGLDLDRYHEAVKNIHNQNASTGLRQVAFETLMELKKKWTWKEKIRTKVFPEANLKKLDLRDAELQKTQLWKTNLQGADLSRAKLRGATLWRAELQRATLDDAELQGANLRYTKLEGAISLRVKLQGANLTMAELQDADLMGAELQEAELYTVRMGKNTILWQADLENAELGGAFYYKSKEDEENSKKTFVNKEWLDNKGAWGLDTVKGIPEK